MESMTRPAQRKKMTKGSGVVTSFSSKGGYDGVFSAPAAEKSFKPPAAVEDYNEVFATTSRSSSIPVLDLFTLDQTTQNFTTLKVDYQNIFGGFLEDLGVPYEELVNTASATNKLRNHSEKEFPLQGADTCNLSGNTEKSPSEVSDPSLDAMKQFNMSYLKTSQGNKNQSNGTTHVAKLHAVPGFTYFVNEPPSKQKTESGMHIPPLTGEVHHTWSFSANIPDKNNLKTEMPLPSKAKAESGAKGGSQSKDGLSLNGRESYMKSQSFNSAPSSNHPLESLGIGAHPERSKSSYISSKANPFEKSTCNGTDGSSDEELYINSDAAACAASLKRVLEKAQESIRLAKEIRERGEKDGLQRFSNLSSEYISKAKDKKKHRSDQEANSSEKQNVKDRHERLGSESHESDQRNRRLGSRTTGVSTSSECNQEPVTSIEAEKGSPLDITEVVGMSKQFLDLVDTKKSIPATLASYQVEINKNPTSLLTGKQESLASLPMEKQEIVIGETTISETLEQIKINDEIGKSIANDFGMGNAENNIYDDEQTQAPEVTANASDSAPVKHEFKTSVGLENTEEDARFEDRNCILDELRHREIKLPECLDSSEGKKSETSNIEYQHMLNESQNMAEKEQKLANCEGYQEVQLGLQFGYSQGEKENGLYSCNEGRMVLQKTCGFVVSDDAPGVCSSRSPERTRKDSQDGEACETSNGLESCSEGGVVQQEDCGFVASDDAPEVCGSGIRETTHKYDQEGEACGTSNAIHEIGVEDSELHSEHKEEEEAVTLPDEELKKKVVEDLGTTEKKSVHVPHEEISTKVLKEEHWKEEDQKRPEETYNQLKVDWNPFGEEFDRVEVEKRIKRGCIMEDTEIVGSEKYKISACQNAVKIIQETEENTFVHVENANLDHEQIDLLQKAAHEKNFDPDAYVSLHDIQEAHSTAAVDDHEVSNSTTSTSEEFYNCEWEGNSEEVVLEGCELEITKLDKKGDFAQCPFEEGVSSTVTPFPSMAVGSGENGTNADHDGLIRKHKLPQEKVLETTNFIQNADKVNDIRFKLQDITENEIATNVAFSADMRGRVTSENVKEPESSVNPESGGDFHYRFREITEHVDKEFSFDKDVVPKVVCRLENKEKEIDKTNSSAVTHQDKVTQESVEELITGENIQFVRTKPQKNVVPEDNEARESSQKDSKEKEQSRKIEAMKRDRERDKDRIAVERAIREARERAFADARERAERAAVARAGAEVRQRMMAEAQDKLEKSGAGKKLADKASIEAKQRAERAAVERATAEARERALEKALSQKSTAQERVQTDRHSGYPKDSALKHSFSTSDLESFDGNNSESAQRRKARLERHERIMERAAKALADKNMRDIQAQKEQAERNRLAESLDADVKRWASGKERNLRALLSTLQYILGPDSGWQPVSLTEIITAAAVKKAYRKATLYVHPDKLQQRGASIQEKYICEKVFYLLKAAWSKFNSEER